MSLIKKKLKWQEINKKEEKKDVKIAILSSFTANSLEPYLGVELEEKTIKADIKIAPYNQIIQECLDENSQTSKYKPNIIIVWIRLEDYWKNLALPLNNPLETYLSNIMELANCVLSFSKKHVCKLIFILPNSPTLSLLGVGENSNPLGSTSIAESIRHNLRLFFSNHPNVLLWDMNIAFFHLSISNVFDFRLNSLADIPFSKEAFDFVAHHLSRLISLLYLPSPKVLALDADNTLWPGVVAEDGVLSLTPNSIASSFLDFQRWLLNLRLAGWLLVLISKNHPHDLLPIFDRNDMLLKLHHFSSYRINWLDKHSNLLSISSDLNLSPSHFVFIDDNPAEIAQMSAFLPQVRSLLFPSDVTSWPLSISSSPLFDRLPPNFSQEKNTTLTPFAINPEINLSELNLKAFLSKLELKIDISAITTKDCWDIANLTKQVTQFHFTGEHFNEDQILNMIETQGYTCLAIKLSDRFGDYGLVGTMILKTVSSTIVIEAFLLSCRAFGRNVEYRMLNHIGNIAKNSSCDKVQIKYSITKKNFPAINFLEDLAKEINHIKTNLTYTFPTSYIVNLSENIKAPISKTQTAFTYPTLHLSSELLNKIALELSQPEKVLSIIQDQKRSRPKLPVRFEAFSNNLEQKIANIWQEVLNIETVGISDNFFDLGGKSFLMVEVCSKLQKDLNKQLSLIELFDHPTISSLSKYLSKESGKTPSFEISQARAETRREMLQKQQLLRKRN